MIHGKKRTYRFGGVQIDPAQRRIERGGQKQHLREKAFSISEKSMKMKTKDLQMQTRRFVRQAGKILSIFASILILGSFATVHAQDRNISVSILFGKDCGISGYASLQMSTEAKQWAGGYADFNLPPGSHNLKVNVTQPELIIISISYTDVIIPRDQEFIVNAPNANVPITVSPGPTPSGRQARIQILMTCGEVEQRLPIIFLPGVAGTTLILHTGQPRGPVAGPVLWPLADGERAHLGLNEDGKTKRIPGSPVVVGDILRGFGGPMDFYGTILAYLREKKGYTELDFFNSNVGKVNLFTFAYDWRFDNATHFTNLDKFVDDALKQSPEAKKVILLAHSMGGYIARAYILSSPTRAAKVDSLITLGTPYWGAPMPYYGAVSGYTFGNLTVRQQLMKILIQNFPAAYQLMPNYPFIIDSANKRILTLEESYSTEESARLKYKGFTDVHPSLSILKDTYDETADNIWSFNPGLVKLAQNFNKLFGTKENPTPLPAGIKHYVIIGVGVKTLTYFYMRDARPPERFLELGARSVVLEPFFSDGDGTVPLQGSEISTATSTYYIPYVEKWGFKDSSAHGDLPSNGLVQNIVGQIIDRKPPEPYKYKYPRKRTTLKDVEEGVDFTLRSDAYLTITDQSTGRKLGFNTQGGIHEDLPSGTFLAMEGVEYASIADINRTLKVTVTGIRVGKFTLDVNVNREGSAITPFSYREVPVKPGTVAEVTMIPGQASPPPPLTVTTDGRTTTVPASIGNTGGGALPPTPTAAKACDWTGTWKVNQESFSFRQIVGLPHGQAPVTQVSGTGITDPSWRLTGTVHGNVLTGIWSNSNGSGIFRITMSSDCNSFSSRWSGDNITTFSATGARLGNQGVVGLPQEVIPENLPELEELPEDELELSQEATRQDSATGTLTTGTIDSPVLELIEVKQEPSCAIWPTAYDTCNSGEITTKDKSAKYVWTDPPKQIGAQGFKLDLYVYAKAPIRSRLVTGINVIPGGLQVDANPPRADVDSENGIEKENRLSVIVRPPSNPSGVYELRIGVTWGAGYIYRYRVLK